MKLFRLSALALVTIVCAPAIAQTDPTGSGLPAASSINGAELLPIYQGGQPVVSTLTAACSTHAATAGAPLVTGLPGAAAITGSEIVALYQNRALVASTATAVCLTHAAGVAAPNVTGLPGSAALTGPELVPVWQNGQRLTATITQIAALFGSGPVFAIGSLDFSDPQGTGTGIATGLI